MSTDSWLLLDWCRSLNPLDRADAWARGRQSTVIDRLTIAVNLLSHVGTKCLLWWLYGVQLLLLRRNSCQVFSSGHDGLAA